MTESGVTRKSLTHHLIDWLECHWAAPAYGGWVLLGLTIFFFGAATNTLSGWLYVMSGVGLALLGLSLVMAVRSLQGLQIVRLPIEPVSAGEILTVNLEVHNQTPQTKVLLQVRDLLPFVLDRPAHVSIPSIASQSFYSWRYTCPTTRRGVFRWHGVDCRSGAPFGLFWCRRTHEVSAKAIVYPPVLPLTRCPLVDEMGRDQEVQILGDRQSQSATEGGTRSLRPYRWGDPLRLVHWRSSARYGEIRVRELELLTGGQDIIIALDSGLSWSIEHFEQAVIAAASLYFYGRKRQFSVRFWSQGTGLIQGDRPVLEALAAIVVGETSNHESLPNRPVIWLTADGLSCKTLPPGSRWILWPADPSSPDESKWSKILESSGLVIQRDAHLSSQLQQPMCTPMR